MLTIVRYRRVRNAQPGRLHHLRAMDLKSFRGQLDYLGRRHTVVTMEEVMYAAQGSPADLPTNAAILIFADGLIDHYMTVLPLLDERGWQGSFFVPVQPVLQHKVLDLHKLHAVLDGLTDVHAVFDHLLDVLDEYRDAYDLLSADEYWQRLARVGEDRRPEIAFIEQLVHAELPAPAREAVCDALFSRYVTQDEKAFLSEVYLSLDQLKIMQRLGMHVGVHGETHCRLDRLTPEARQREIRASLGLLELIGADTDSWTIAYPFGAQDEALRAQLRSAGARIGITREAGRADLWRRDPLLLPSLEADDLPKALNAARVPVVVGTTAAAEARPVQSSVSW